MNLGMYNGNRRDNWRTPNDLFGKLNEQYRFTFDLAADPQNAKTDDFWTLEDDALSCSWSRRE
jgi:hypothetical protein